MFSNYGIIQFEKNKISEEEAFDIAINAGAKDCINLKDVFEIITEKEDFYKVKNELEKKIDTFYYSAIEWRARIALDLNKEQSEKILDILSALEELDDVQNIFINANLENIQI
jgi:transcriptional/translational regulatory protein YebC/TACO1